MKKALLFDIGNVLFHFSYPLMCQQIAEVIGRSTQLVDRELTDNQYGIQYETGQIELDTLISHFNQLASRPFSAAEFTDAACSIFSPNNEVIDLVQELKNRDHPLLIISNTCTMHFDFLCSNYSVFSLFDHHIVSHKIGARKPDRHIFKAALNAAKREAHDCFYIDDILDYVAAANALGIDGFHYTPKANLKQELVNRGFLD